MQVSFSYIYFLLCIYLFLETWSSDPNCQVKYEKHIRYGLIKVSSCECCRGLHNPGIKCDEPVKAYFGSDFSLSHCGSEAMHKTFLGAQASWRWMGPPPPWLAIMADWLLVMIPACYLWNTVWIGCTAQIMLFLLILNNKKIHQGVISGLFTECMLRRFK